MVADCLALLYAWTSASRMMTLSMLTTCTPPELQALISNGCNKRDVIPLLPQIQYRFIWCCNYTLLGGYILNFGYSTPKLIGWVLWLANPYPASEISWLTRSVKIQPKQQPNKSKSNTTNSNNNDNQNNKNNPNNITSKTNLYFHFAWAKLIWMAFRHWFIFDDELLPNTDVSWV